MIVAIGDVHRPDLRKPESGEGGTKYGSLTVQARIAEGERNGACGEARQAQQRRYQGSFHNIDLLKVTNYRQA